MDCSGHGKCKDASGGAVCICDKGYHAEGNFQCVETKDPCEGVTCSGKGKCQNLNGRAMCACEPGYKVKNNIFCTEEERQPFTNW